MSNAFDSANYPTSEPASVRVGDRWAWKRADLTDYPPASYTLKYSLRLEIAPTTEIEITATGSGAEYVVEVASATTAAYAAGWYRMTAFIIRQSDSERVEVLTRRIQVLPNTDASSAESRTHARIMLAKIEAVLENRADSDVQSYAIAGRSLARMSVRELTEWRDYYASRVANEDKAEDIARGFGAPKLRVRF